MPATPTPALRLLLCATLALSAAPGHAAQGGEGNGARALLADCAQVGAAADRLACYDRLAGRAPAPEAPAEGQDGVPATTSKLAPKAAPVAAVDKPSLLSRFWELDDHDKRGVFNFTGYRANYVLPLHATTHINRRPMSPTQDAVSLDNYKRVEAKFQLSLRTKALQDVGLPGSDVWLGFTQRAFWQIWNGRDSKPFRNSDYEPEATYIVPTQPRLRPLPLSWQWRYTQLSLVHQSNGQSDPLSRSWNRLALGGGFERGDWSLVARINHRLGERRASDNNPDLVAYRGRADFQLAWNGGLHTTSLLMRTTLKNTRYGALEFEWTYPVFRDQPNGLRWYLQAFSGYGETLTDYNFRQNSVGAGVSFMQF